MRRMSYFLKCLFVCLLSAYLVCIQQQAFAQAIPTTMYNSCGASDAGLVNLNVAGTYLNRQFDMVGGTSNGLAMPNCPTTAPTNQRDGWLKVQANITGSIVFTYTPNTATDNPALVVYDAGDAGTPIACATTGKELQCANVNGAGVTETVTISTVINRWYYLRVSNLVNADITGTLSIYNGPRATGDLCVDATTIAIGTCNFPYTISSTFYHNEKTFASCPGPILYNNQDGWLKITVPANKEVRVRYSNANKNPALAAYTGTCGNLTQVVCNQVIAPLEATVDFAAGGVDETYYVRVLNTSDDNGMSGFVCVTELLSRDDIGLALGATNVRIKLGDCNQRVDVPLSFAPTGGVAKCSENTAQEDAWMIYEATSTLPVRFEYSSLTNNQQPDVVIYNLGAGGVNSGNVNPTVLAGALVATDASGNDACASGTGTESAGLDFQAVAGNWYAIRIINRTGAFNMEGVACMYDGSKKSEDRYFTSKEFAVDGSDCGKQFNLLSSFEDFGGINNAIFTTNNEFDCNGTPTVTTNDAWGYFVTPGVLPTAGYTIQFNNDNQDASLAKDVVLALYEGPANPLPTLAGTDRATCAAANGAPEFISPNTQITNFNVPDRILSQAQGPNTSFDGAYNPTGASPEPGEFSAIGERWVRLDGLVLGDTISVVYESTNGDASIELFPAGCGLFTGFDANDLKPVTLGTTKAGVEAISFVVDGTNILSGSAIVRILNNANQVPGGMTGSLTIYRTKRIPYALCVNNVVEGTDQFIFSSVNGLQANTRYYVRVANVGNAQNSTTGTICIQDNTVPPGDVCSNALKLNVNTDCDRDFDLDATFTIPTKVTGTTPTGTCAGIASLVSNPPRDGWITFTALSSQTTLEFYNSSAETAVAAVYRGSCGSLIFSSCYYNTTTLTNDIVADEVAKIKINTIAGLQYYVQIINKANNSNLTGSICLYDTAERDVCDDADLVTKTVGSCNISFDIPASFDNSPVLMRNFSAAENPFVAPGVTENGGAILQYVTSSCETQFLEPNNPDNNPNQAAAKDAWIRMIGNGNDVTLSYQNREGTSDPSLIVYTALKSVGPINCGIGLDGAGNPGNQYACTNKVAGNSPQTEAVTFKTNAGQIYLIRVLDMSGTGMTGTLCISDGRADYDDPCTTSTRPPRVVSMGTCGIPLNVLSGINTCYNGTLPSNPLMSNPTSSQYAGNGGTIGTCSDASCSNGDVWATVTIPNTCDPALAPAPGLGGVNCTGNYKYDVANNKCICKETTIAPNALTNGITIQYDNRDGLINNSTNKVADVELVIYTTTNCSNGNNYTKVGCSDIFQTANAAGSEGVETVSIASVSAGNTYLIRVINKTANKSAFGELCLVYGTSLGEQTACVPVSAGGTNAPPNNAYNTLPDDLDGEYRNFNISRVRPGQNAAGQNPPSDVIPNCVIAGQTSAPATYANYPIRADAWTKFSVPLLSTYQAVTVQFDNSTDVNRQNVAVAVYGSRNNLVTNCNAYSNPANIQGMELIDCSNTTFIGTESVTIKVTPGYTYYVRVMNLVNSANTSALAGRIRVFPYAQCDLGENLITDGTFAGWPAINRVDASTQDTYPLGVSAATYDAQRNNDIFSMQTILNTSAYPNDLDSELAPGRITGIARFATVFGYTRDRTGTLTGLNAIGGPETGVANAYQATFAQLSGNMGELSNEGLYVVKQTPWLLKNDWFGYGNGNSGYGGRGGAGSPTQTYCANGAGGNNTEPCTTIDQGTKFYGKGTTVGQYSPFNGVAVGGLNPSIDRPSHVPSTSEANFMIVNGAYDPNNNSLPPAKIWCQTLDRGSDFGKVGYYVFSVWAQNMISSGRNIDVPMLRLTVCDMENPNNLGLNDFPPSTTNLPGSPRSTTTRLPGVTYAKDVPDIQNYGSVYHYPQPVTDRTQAFVAIPAYGAAATCNLSNESRDARLKVLGTQFLIPESPDQWVLLRCVYRAPEQVAEMNVCIENLSLTKNGNDVALDDIAFTKCNNADQETFDRLLKGDPCELTDNPVGLPLPVQYLDFKGRLVGDKVLLDWVTLAEKDLVHFQIQRSIDGSVFTPIGTTDAKGNSNGMSEYVYYDTRLPFGVKTLYYRLNAIEKGGYAKLGPVIAVDIESVDNFDMKLVPNPIIAGNDVELRFNVPNGQAGVSVSDMVGTRLMSKVIPTTNGDNKVFLNTKGMKSGVYIVRLIHNGKSVAKKLVIL